MERNQEGSDASYLENETAKFEGQARSPLENLDYKI